MEEREGRRYFGDWRLEPEVYREERLARRRVAKRAQKEWFAKVRSGWRPPTAAQRREHAEAELDLLESIGDLPDPMRALLAWESQPGRDRELFLDRWRSREWE